MSPQRLAMRNLKKAKNLEFVLYVFNAELIIVDSQSKGKFSRVLNYMLFFGKMQKEQTREQPLFVETLEDRVLLSAAGAGVDAEPIAASNTGSAWVGNRIWNDENGNGWQDRGETGVADVNVLLFEEGNSTAIASMTTGSTGLFNFQNLPGGIYTIEVDAPTGWTITTPNVISNDVGDSDADTSGVIGPFELAEGEINTNLDVGLRADDFVQTAWVGNRVWNDFNANGRQDVGESGVAGVEVHLLAQGSIDPIASAITNANGLYNFLYVAPGEYSIQVIAPQSATFTTANVGPNNVGDSDADENGIISSIVLDPGEVDTNQDVGLVFPSRIGNRVWNDSNGDGWQSLGELGVANVEVSLFEQGSSTAVRTALTSSQGLYNFTDVLPGTYTLKFTPPEEWTFTTAINTGSLVGNSDADANGVIGPFTVGSGEINTNLDAGLLAADFLAPARVGNRVWNDFNQNGLQDADELGIHGVEVRLIQDGEVEPIQTEVTNLQGLFNFKDVAPGTYTIEAIAPENFEFTSNSLISGVLNSDVNALGISESFDLAPGEINTNLDVGLIAGPTFLSRLQIDGVEIDVHPSFSPLIQRYSVNPSDATAGFSITAFTASSTDTLRVNGTAAASGVSVDIAPMLPGETVTIEVSNPIDGTRTYEVIYLPVGFPTLEVTTFKPGVSDGPLFLSLRQLTVRPPFFLAIVDNYGVPTFVLEPDGRPSDFKQLSDGTIQYAVRNGDFNEFGRESVDQVLLDEDFNEIARLNVVGDLNHTDPHDFLILPNGNHVFLSYNGEIRDGVVFEDSVIQVVDPTTGLEVFRWNSKDEIPLDDVLRANRQEYAHINSVFLDTDGNFIASLRGTSQVVKIDSNTGEIIWKLGGLSSDFTIDDPLGGPCGQHTATRLANGNLMVFDNGAPCPDLPGYENRGLLTRVAEYEIDELAMTAKLVWSYSQPGFYSTAAGSAQRLANGNTLIGWGRNAEGFVTEVDANGNKVYEVKAYSGDNAYQSYRAFKSDFPSDVV